MEPERTNMAEKLLFGMLKAGQKATKIAQLCRAEESLFKILVQEKGRLKSNDMDFKTLADVFIQQVAKTELEKEVGFYIHTGCGHTFYLFGTVILSLTWHVQLSY